MSELNFIEINAETINSELIKDFEQAFGETLYPGDERRIFLEQLTQVIVSGRNNINETAKKNLVRYASGDVLDALGEFYGTERLQAEKATVKVRFNLSTAQTSNITIPSGTRVTPDGSLFFETINDSIVTAGLTYIDLALKATSAGSKYNGFTAGQIKTLVDPTAYISSVSNIETSVGGTDIESDDDYKERIRLAPQSFSVAGPEGAYKYFALSADSSISDVSVSSPSAGVVKVVVLQENGTIPTQPILDKVLAILSDKTKRPLTDNVQVAAPSVLSYDINLTFYIDKENQTEEATIRNAIEGTGGAIDSYVSWQQSNLGKAINPDYLRKLILNSGADRVDIVSPLYTALTLEQIGKVGTKTINYGGLE